MDVGVVTRGEATEQAKHPDSQPSPGPADPIEGAIVSMHSEAGTSVPHVEEVHSGVLTATEATGVTLDGVARDQVLLHLERHLSQGREDGWTPHGLSPMPLVRTDPRQVRTHRRTPMRAVPRLAPLQHGQGHRWGPKPPVLVHNVDRTLEGR